MYKFLPGSSLTLKDNCKLKINNSFVMLDKLDGVMTVPYTEKAILNIYDNSNLVITTNVFGGT